MQGVAAGLEVFAAAGDVSVGVRMTSGQKTSKCCSGRARTAVAEGMTTGLCVAVDAGGVGLLQLGWVRLLQQD